MGLVEQTINDYAKRARHLRKRLDNGFLEFTAFNDDSAKKWLELSLEYKFLTTMFSDMNIFDWSNEDFKYEQ